MNTRHAHEDSAFRQERYMSSPELQSGLLANCVAKRLQTLADPQQRKLIWFLQALSRKPGGLSKVAEEIITLWPGRFATPSMARLGFDTGRIYNAEEIRIVKSEMETESFPLRGECEDWGSVIYQPIYDEWGVEDENWKIQYRQRRAKELRQARSLPKCYPATAFHEECLDVATKSLGKFLFQELCLNPAVAIDPSPLWFLPSLLATLNEYHDLYCARQRAGADVITQIGAKINATLDYALEGRCLVVVDGLSRTGKTFAVRKWADAHPGQVRYCQVPSTNDDISFFRAICLSLGLGCGSAFKAVQLREKIEDVLRAGDLLLILDEGHYLWPQRNMRKAVPHRINWMLTQLVNMGVPVAIVTTPQFTKNQETLVQHGGWSSEQLIGRIMHYERLPDALNNEDLEAVARYWLPGGEEKAIRLLTAFRAVRRSIWPGSNPWFAARVSWQGRPGETCRPSKM